MTFPKKSRVVACLATALLLCWAAWVVAVRARDYPSELILVDKAASLTLVDRHGELIWRAGAADGEQRDWVGMGQISPLLVHATLAGEDHRFYDHDGVDPLGILRALWLNLSEARVGYGASTITMQLVRLLEPGRNTRSVIGKLSQALAAARLERRLGKQQILNQYLNRAYYGNGAVGVEAAARLYFGTSAATLSPAQAAFLAVLPRAPSGYDPYRHRERAQSRQHYILERMHELGFIDQGTFEVARAAPLRLLHVRHAPHARHFIDHVLTTVAPETLQGKRVQSSMDLALQQRLEIAVSRHIDTIGGRNVAQAGLVVLDNASGDILAMVGSRGYQEEEQSGAVNVTTIRRRPGSTLKPFVYALALEQGDSPATIAMDVVLPGEVNETYTHEVRQHGFARYREALAGSYNLAAVHTLQRVGVKRLLSRLRLAGVVSLDAPDESYGPDLAIGHAEFVLLEYAGAFAAFGNDGKAVRPGAVRQLTPAAVGGRGDAPSVPFPIAPSSEFGSLGQHEIRVFTPQIAYQIFDILSDPDARRPMFGSSAPMDLPFPVALKTGTTRGYTDNLAFGTTKQYTVGAWAGNFDGRPMDGVMAMQGAAPLVRAAFVALAALYGEPTAPERPSGLEERDVCPISGQRLGPHCPNRKHELLSASAARALDESAACTYHTHEHANGLAFPDELSHWARAHGLPGVARADSPREGVALVSPQSGARYVLEPQRDPKLQLPPLRAIPLDANVTFTIDGRPAEEFVPSPGQHLVRVERGQFSDEAKISFE